MAGVFDHRAVIATPVGRGRPFQAEFEEIRTSRRDGKQVRRAGHIYVDGEGRVRQDEEGEAAGAVLDPVANVMYFVDRESNAVLFQAELPLSLRSEPVPPEKPKRELGGSGIQMSGEDVGIKVIEGLTCRGYRTSVEGTGAFVAETWISTDVGVAVLEKKTTAQEDVQQRLFSIRFGEPDPSLFKRPAK